mgnify:FL=1
MNLANKLTVLRVILVPIFMVFIASENIPYGSFIATGIFIIASITDKLDGYIARSRNQVTNFGKFMDPLADKLLVSSALVALVQVGGLSSWAAVIIIAREFAVTGLRTVAASEGIVIAANKLGKTKTVLQMIALIASLIQLGVQNSSLRVFCNVAMFAAVIMTIISGVEYFWKNSGVFKGSM